MLKHTRFLFMHFCIFFSAVIIFTFTPLTDANEAPENDISSPASNDSSQLPLSEEELSWILSNPEIRLGYDLNWPPYDFRDSSNRFQGISADVLLLIEQRTGLKFTRTAQDNWGDTYNLAVAGELDILSGTTASPQRDRYFNFTAPYFTPKIVMYTRKDDTTINRFEDLSVKRVAIESQYYLHERLKADYPDIELYEVSNTTQAITAVSHGLADAYIGNQGATSWVIEENGFANLRLTAVNEFGTAPLRFAVRKDWPQLQSIMDKAITSISQSELATIRRKWLGVAESPSTFSLSNAEREWLQNNAPFTFTGDPNWLPYEAFDSDGNYIGIVAEYLKLIQNRLGVEINIVRTSSWAESLEKANAKEIDVLSETSNSSLRSVMEFTDEYVSSPIVIIMRDEIDYIESLDDISDKRITLVQNYGYSPEVMSKYSYIDFANVDSIQEGLIATSVGEVDAMLATLAQASYHISSLGLNNVRIVGKTSIDTSLAFGIQPELSPLVPLFNRALEDISEREKQAIFSQWGKQQFPVIVDYTIALITAGFLLLIIAVIAYWNRKLGREVEYRKELEMQQKAIIDHMPVQILLSKLNGNIITANPKTLTDYKVSEEELHKYKISHFFRTKEDLDVLAQEIAKNGMVDQKVIPFNNPDGKVHSMMVSIIPITYLKKPAFLSIAVDITERLEIEKQLKKTIVVAQKANAAKSQFLANMSHEIRTPMNAIIGYTDLLHEQLKEPKLKSFAKIIQKAGNNLLVLINDILDLSKIEAKKLDIELRPCDPHQLFSEIGDIFALRTGEKNIDLLLDIDNTIPESLMLDYTRLRQVLFNLVGNAVKFTEKGHIRLSAKLCHADSATDSTENANTVDLVIDIEDTGIGIAPEYHELIFEKFEQSDGQDVRQYSGTGLGLSISKRLAELMGGSLSVKSSLGEGSTFTVRLNNVDRSSELAEHDIEETNLDIYVFKPAKVLIVDDVKDNRELLQAYFDDSKISVMSAKDGVEAVELCSKQEFDAVLMDIRMPQMNGYQAAEVIKQSSTVPIIALTASVMTDQFERLRSSNFDGYLRKPVIKQALFSELSQFLEFEIEKQTSHEAPTFIVDEAQIPQIERILPHLKNLINRYGELDKMSNMNSINQFYEALKSINAKPKVSVITDYHRGLGSAIDAFDIAEIKLHLAKFPKLVEQLEDLAQK